MEPFWTRLMQAVNDNEAETAVWWAGWISDSDIVEST